MSASRLSSMLDCCCGSLLLVTPTFGELPLRVRGTIIAKDDRHIRVKERVGRVFQLNTSPTTKYAKVVASNLGAIKLNTYIATCRPAGLSVDSLRSRNAVVDGQEHCGVAAKVPIRNFVSE